MAKPSGGRYAFQPVKSHNIHPMKPTAQTVTAAERTQRNEHAGVVLWLTGLSASGKSTIAEALERELFNKGRQVYVLDGDKMRLGLCSDLNFSPESRKENIRRVGEVAKLFADAGIICITAFISPYRSDRDLVRSIMPAGSFIEVFVNAPLAVCEQRDPKGLYARARAGLIKDFTGISAPYEPPVQPELELHTDQMDAPACVAAVVRELERREKVAGPRLAPASV
jgi:adenylyl-sulfate kinase